METQKKKTQKKLSSTQRKIDGSNLIKFISTNFLYAKDFQGLNKIGY